MIIPNWKAPAHIKACTITKSDDIKTIPLPSPILQMKQVHDNEIIIWDERTLSSLPAHYKIIDASVEVDGQYTQQKNIICGIRTADCLPILVTDQAGTEVAALHAGWRGLAKGIIEKGIAQFKAPPHQLIAWLGPAICAQHYEVGEEVYHAFISQDAQLAPCFVPTRPQHWLADITAIAEHKLKKLGFSQISRYEGCTFENTQELNSYRRDKADAGRLWHLIWIE